jgi:hypothetical protein
LRYFITRRVPHFHRVLLVESGSRAIFNDFIPEIRRRFNAQNIDLVTCYAGVPEGFEGEVFRVTDYPGGVGRQRLLETLKVRQHQILAIICSGEPVMTKWKWYLAAKIPAKVLVVNENGDYFWIERAHWRNMLKFVLVRAGLTGAEAVPTIARLLFFPFTLTYLLVYAGWVHLKRALRT